MTILKVVPHLDTEKLGQRYRQSQVAVERSHYQIVWLLSQNRSVGEVAEITKYSERWVFEIARRFNEDGPNGLGDRRCDNPGARNALLTPIQERDLRIALVFSSPLDGGIWNGRKVADWIANVIGRPVSPQRGWDYLKKLGYRRRKPRPQHVKADQVLQQDFKKNC